MAFRRPILPVVTPASMIDRVAVPIILFVCAPILVSHSTSRWTRGCVAALAIALSASTGTLEILMHALLASASAGAIGVVLHSAFDARVAASLCGMALTVPLLFLLPCHLVPSFAAPYYLRGAEVIVLCVSLTHRSTSMTDAWTIWSSSPSMIQNEVTPNRRPSAESIGILMTGLGMLVLAEMLAQSSIEMGAPVLASCAAVAIGMPAQGTMRYGGCLLAGFDPRPGFILPVLAADLRGFWARWNTWYGRAFALLVHARVTRRLLRWTAGGRRASVHAGAVGVMATFVCVGVHHDICRALVMVSSESSQSSPLHAETLLLFVLLGFAAVLDLYASRLGSRVWRGALRLFLVVVSLGGAISFISAFRI